MPAMIVGGFGGALPMPAAGANQDPVPHHTGDSHRPKPEAQAGAVTASDRTDHASPVKPYIAS
jgi:hypothetical protein